MMAHELQNALNVYHEETLKRGRATCLVCMAIINSDSAGDVMNRLYASDALDDLTGINGRTRHVVFVDWLHRNPGRVLDAINFVNDAIWKARDAALYRVECFLDWRCCVEKCGRPATIFDFENNRFYCNDHHAAAPIETLPPNDIPADYGSMLKSRLAYLRRAA